MSCHVLPLQFSWCNVGSACREDFRKANGSEYEIWPELNPKERKTRIRSEKNRLKLNEYQPMLVPKYTEVRMVERLHLCSIHQNSFRFLTLLIFKLNLEYENRSIQRG